MARYRPIYTAIWEDEEQFLNYSDEQKVLFFYLITNDKCTESGIYKVSIRNVSAILTWPQEKTMKILNSLKPNAYYDEKTQCVFVKNFLKYNGFRHGRPDLIVKSVVKDRINFETPLWSWFLTTYPKFTKSITKGLEPFHDNDNESLYDFESESPERKKNISKRFVRCPESVVVGDSLDRCILEKDHAGPCSANL